MSYFSRVNWFWDGTSCYLTWYGIRVGGLVFKPLECHSLPNQYWFPFVGSSTYFQAINTADRLQRRMPDMSLSPSWCMCHTNAESPVHLSMHCSFATKFWDIVLLAFGWSYTCSNNISEILASLLVGHPFCGTKKTMWLAIIRAFL